VKVYRLTESGGEQLVRLMSPGDFLGETALLADATSDHFAEALRPSEICSLGREPVTRLLAERPGVALQMLQTVSDRLGTAEQRLSALTGHSAGQRLAQQLLYLADEAGSSSFRLPTTKKDLASYVGTSPETLSRRLGALQESGIIRLGPGRTVEVLDPAQLQGRASSWTGGSPGRVRGRRGHTAGASCGRRSTGRGCHPAGTGDRGGLRT
jgi:CRP/FNR family transcriptional regulator